ncbi:MAG TPA: hypothetical protein VHO06_04810 [Polyangia bacterium]|nr:hypothetical protein [Polyangia bacterium]
MLALGGTAWSQPAPTEAPPPPAVPEAPPPPPMEAAPVAAPMAPPAPAPSAPSFKIDAGGGTTLKIGLLLQPQFQMLGNTELDGNSYNLFIRRTRLLVGGTLFGAFEYFFDTDYPNLFLADNTPANAMTMTAASTVKLTPGMNVQDAFVTWKPVSGPYKDAFKIDAGYMLPPMAHNAVQSATSLYSWDYFAFTFLSTANTLLGSQASPVGRDLGVQVRGLLFDGHLEYRAGLFQGLRDTDSATDVGSNNFFRAVGRLQVNLLDAEPGFFYAGTYLGKKRILSFGISGDTQRSYHYVAGDGFADLPLGPGVFTAQVDVVHWNGGTFVPGLPKETAVMGEVGFNVDAINVSPILHAEYLWAPAADLGHFGGGLAFWPYGHNSNLKAFYTRNTTTAAMQHADNQINVQWQLYFF